MPALLMFSEMIKSRYGTSSGLVSNLVFGGFHYIKYYFPATHGRNVNMSLSFDPRIRQGCVAEKQPTGISFKYIEIGKLEVA